MPLAPRAAPSTPNLGRHPARDSNGLKSGPIVRVRTLSVETASEIAVETENAKAGRKVHAVKLAVDALSTFFTPVCAATVVFVFKSQETKFTFAAAFAARFGPAIRLQNALS